jgi:hypothetical protein
MQYVFRLIALPFILFLMLLVALVAMNSIVLTMLMGWADGWPYMELVLDQWIQDWDPFDDA